MTDDSGRSVEAWPSPPIRVEVKGKGTVRRRLGVMIRVIRTDPLDPLVLASN